MTTGLIQPLLSVQPNRPLDPGAYAKTESSNALMGTAVRALKSDDGIQDDTFHLWDGPPLKAADESSLEDDLREVLMRMYDVQEHKMRDATKAMKRKLGEIHDLQNALAKLRESIGNKVDTDSIDFNKIMDAEVKLDKDSPLFKSDRSEMRQRFEELFQKALDTPEGQSVLKHYDMDKSSLCMGEDGRLQGRCGNRGGAWGWIGTTITGTNALSAWGQVCTPELLAANKSMRLAGEGEKMSLRDILAGYGVETGSPTTVKELNVLIQSVQTKTDSMSQSSQIDMMNLSNTNQHLNEAASTVSQVQETMHQTHKELVQNL